MEVVSVCCWEAEMCHMGGGTAGCEGIAVPRLTLRCTAHHCRLRDELMDDVADFLDDMPEEQRNGMSYGELLSKVCLVSTGQCIVGGRGCV